MTPTELRRKLASIEELLRRGVKDGIVVRLMTPHPHLIRPFCRAVFLVDRNNRFVSTVGLLLCSCTNGSAKVTGDATCGRRSAVGRRRQRNLQGASPPEPRGPPPARRSFPRFLPPLSRRHRRLHLRWPAKPWRPPPHLTLRHVARPAPKVCARLDSISPLTFCGMAAGAEGRRVHEENEPGAHVLACTSDRGAHARGSSWAPPRTSGGQFPGAPSRAQGSSGREGLHSC
jgi:hypothetical protein